jgi:hypothetical protein
MNAVTESEPLFTAYTVRSSRLRATAPWRPPGLATPFPPVGKVPAGVRLPSSAPSNFYTALPVSALVWV